MLGYSVISAPTVGEAMRLCGEQEFDLILSDMGLPDGSGLDLLQKLREIKNTPAIVMSGYGKEEDAASWKEAGFASCFFKPVDIELLEEAIVKAIAAPEASTFPKREKRVDSAEPMAGGAN
jgi:DNA-binding NtrC family response regulator